MTGELLALIAFAVGRKKNKEGSGPGPTLKLVGNYEELLKNRDKLIKSGVLDATGQLTNRPIDAKLTAPSNRISSTITIPSGPTSSGNARRVNTVLR